MILHQLTSRRAFAYMDRIAERRGVAHQTSAGLAAGNSLRERHELAKRRRGRVC